MYFDSFDICAAHYLFLSYTHSGQYSPAYRRLCHMSRYFCPSPTLRVDSLGENGLAIYNNLLVKAGLPPEE